MKKPFIIISIAVFIFIFMCCCCVYCTIKILSLSEENAAIKISMNTIKKVNDNNTIVSNKILMIEKTLILCYYSLSKWEARYYAIYFNDFSKQYKIPWEIYPAIIYTESRFKTTLVSKSKCKGLMQLKEATGKETAEKIGIGFIAEQTLWNEFLNLPIGCSYLSQNIKNKGLEGGIKSYIGGPEYLKNLSNIEVKKYIDRYTDSVYIQYKRLSFVYRGVVAELSGKNDSVYIDNASDMKLNLDPFETSNSDITFK